MGKLDQKVAIVTGAGRGAGRGIALAMAKEGAASVGGQRLPARQGQTACPSLPTWAISVPGQTDVPFIWKLSAELSAVDS